VNSSEADVSCGTGLKQILDLFPLFRLYSFVIKVAVLCNCVMLWRELLPAFTIKKTRFPAFKIFHN
jgi:hypothetical protein